MELFDLDRIEERTDAALRDGFDNVLVLVDEPSRRFGHLCVDDTPVFLRGDPGEIAGSDETIDDLRHAATGHHERVGQIGHLEPATAEHDLQDDEHFVEPDPRGFAQLPVELL